MTIGAVNPAALARIIEVNRKADLAATVVGYGIVVFTVNPKDGTSVIKSNGFRYTRRYRAEKVARKTLHVAHSFWPAYLGLCWGRWA